MKISEMFPSKYLKAADFAEDQVMVATIRNVEMEELTKKNGEADSKPVIYFREKDIKPFVCNKTNAAIINKIYGVDDTDDWIGKRIALMVTQVDSFGEQVDAIRVRAKVPAAPKSEHPVSQPAQIAVEAPKEEELPF